MRYLFLILIIFSSALMATTEEVYEPFPWVLRNSQGGSGAGETSAVMSLGRNPATMAGTNGIYAVFEARQPDQTTGLLFSGLYFGGNYFSLGGGVLLNGISEVDKYYAGNYGFSGASLSSAYIFTKSIHLGVSASHSLSSNYFTSARTNTDVGALYVTEQYSASYFSLHALSLGAKVRIQYQHSPVEKLLISPVAGISAKFLKTKWIESGVSLDFSGVDNFTRVPAEFGLFLDFFKVLRLSAGLSGSDYFLTDKFHAGVSLSMPLENFTATIGSSQNGPYSNTPGELQPRGNLGVHVNLRQSPEEEYPIVIYGHDKKYSFSPNGDGVKDSVTIRIKQELLKDVIDWNFTITKDTKQIYRIENNTAVLENGKPLPVEQFTWDGKDSSGGVLSEGVYNASLFLLKNDKKLYRVPLGEISLDQGQTRALIEINPLKYDLQNENSPLTITVRWNPENVTEVRLEIKNDLGNTVYMNEFPGRVGSIKSEWWPRNLPELTAGYYECFAFMKESSGITSVIKSSKFQMFYAGSSLPLSFSMGRVSSRELSEKGIKIQLLEPAPGGPLKQNRLVFRGKQGENMGSVNFVRGQPLVWYGKNMPPEYQGPVTIQLEEDHEAGPVIVAQGNIVIDNGRPLLEITVIPDEGFIPSRTSDKMLNLRILANDVSPIQSWEVDISDKFKKIIYTEKGKGPPPSLLRWNGYSGDQTFLESDTEYRISVSTVDIVGNRTVSRSAGFRTGIYIISAKNETVNIDTLGSKLSFGNFDSYQIRMPSITFYANSDKPTKGINETLERLLPILRSLPKMFISIEGHVNSNATEKRAVAQDIKLSYDRALKIKNLLIERGIPPERMSVKGWGGIKKIARNNSASEKARNRRVEFVLSPKTESTKLE